MPESAQIIVTVCISCQANLRLDAKYIAKRIRCPKCNAVFEVQAVKFGTDSEAIASRDALATLSEVTQKGANASSSRSTTLEPRKDDDRSKLESSSENAIPSPASRRIEDDSKECSARKIGRYTIENEMGRGAFGVVYAACDPVLQRRVAIKLQMRQQETTSSQKMLQEARAAAKLRHPNIVAVFEVDVEEDRPFVVSELIQGQSLADCIANGPMEPTASATLVRDIARGVGYAHGAGLIHRDVKPQNILIDADGRPQLTDFGLAVDRNDEQQREAASYSRSGTLAYMAPEQAGIGGASVGPAVDQYALAATLFEMLCGQRPHRGGAVEVLAGLEKPEPPRVRSLKTDVPFDLDAICFKAMSHDPWNRYEDCDALADDLDRYLNGELIKGRKIGLVERARHYAKKHPRVAAWATGAGIAATGLLMATSTVVVRSIYIAQKQAATLRNEIDQTKSNIRRNTGIGENQDSSATTSLATWVAYSRKLNSAARAESIGERQLYGKLLDESQEELRDWEYRHLEARRRQGLISTFEIDLPNASRIVAGRDNLSCVVQSASTHLVKHYSIRDGSQLSEWSAANPQTALALAHQSPWAYFAQPKTNSIRSWNWEDQKAGEDIQLAMPASALLVSFDDNWLYASFPKQQFAVVNLRNRQVLFDERLRHSSLPAFAHDSSSLICVVGQQLQKLPLETSLHQLPAGLPITANRIKVLGAIPIDGKITLFHAEWSDGKWSLRKDGVEIAPLNFEPQALRYREGDGALVLCSMNMSAFQIAILKPGAAIATYHTLLMAPPWFQSDIGEDGRLVWALAGQTVYVWDTQRLISQTESDNLSLVQSMALDGKSPQSIVLQQHQVSAVDIDTGKVLWSRQDDQ